MFNITEVLTAKERISPHVHFTPLIKSASLGKLAGNQVYLKLENWQKTGSFKTRGAFNALLSMDREEASRGIVTVSSGNHGQAVAYAALTLGVPAVIVVPVDAVRAKIEAAASYGAEIVFHGTTSEERKQKGQEIASERGMVYLHSFDDYRLIAGQGTVGLEILEQLPKVEAIVAPIGGGGLLSGIAMIKELAPQVKVIGVEPVGAASMHNSRLHGKPVELPRVETIADGLRAARPGERNFAIVQRLVDDLVLVSEEEIKEGVRLLLQRTKVLAEPSGAVSFAALLAGKTGLTGKNVAVVISGGNADFKFLADIISPLDK
ncbi:MAG: threonine ammonia-lyase [Bacillota bacterium]